MLTTGDDAIWKGYRRSDLPTNHSGAENLEASSHTVSLTPWQEKGPGPACENLRAVR